MHSFGAKLETNANSQMMSDIHDILSKLISKKDETERFKKRENKHMKSIMEF